MYHINDLLLTSGHLMPALGIGTSHRGGYSHDALLTALMQCGIHHIDTATRYGCEAKISEAILASRLDRKDLFITSKVFPSNMSFNRCIESVSQSLSDLGLSYLDLCLIHFPDAGHGDKNNTARLETWNALEKLHREGYCQSIGVSNFLPHHLSELLEKCSVRPHVNQCEFHPYHTAREIRAYCRKADVLFTGYSPLAKGAVLNDNVVVDMSRKYGKTAAQVCIRWGLQQGIATIPKSIKPKRIIENADVFDFKLSEEDIMALHCLNTNLHTSWDPSHVI